MDKCSFLETAQSTASSRVSAGEASSDPGRGQQPPGAEMTDGLLCPQVPVMSLSHLSELSVQKRTVSTPPPFISKSHCVPVAFTGSL